MKEASPQLQCKVFIFIYVSYLNFFFLLRETPSDGRTHTKFNRDASVSSMTVDELTAGRQYQFWVTAVTGGGEGKSSNVVSQTPTDRGEFLTLTIILIVVDE